MKISYFVSIIGAFALDYFKTSSLNFNGIFSAFKISTLLTLWWIFYFKYGWKIWGLRKILYKVNLIGTWYGSYESYDAKKENLSKGDIVLRINQDYLNISIISFTKKYINYSYSEELKYEEKSDTHGIIYVYSQRENAPFDLEARNGTSDLRVIKNKNIYRLEGDFWTILGSKGKIKVTRVSKHRVDSFADGKKLYNKMRIGMLGEEK